MSMDKEYQNLLTYAHVNVILGKKMINSTKQAYLVGTYYMILESQYFAGFYFHDFNKQM